MLGTAAAVLLLWLLLFLVLSLVLPVFAPGASYNVLHFATFAIALTLPILVGTVVGYHWVRRVPRERCTVRGTIDDTLSPLIADFRIRSGMYRIAATITFTLLIAVAAAGFFLLSDPARQRAAYHQAVPGQLPDLLAPLIETEAQRETLTEPEVAAILTAVLNRTRYPTWGEVAGTAALWLVLLHTIASLFRSTIRLASFYDARADYLQLGGTPGTEDRRHLLDVVDTATAVHTGWTWPFFRTDGASGPDRN